MTRRSETIESIIEAHFTHEGKVERGFTRVERGKFLFGINGRGEGCFLVSEARGTPSVFNRKNFRLIAEEARLAQLKPPFHVYAKISVYSGPNVEFYQMPLGLF